MRFKLTGLPVNLGWPGAKFAFNDTWPVVARRAELRYFVRTNSLLRCDDFASLHLWLWGKRARENIFLDN